MSGGLLPSISVPVAVRSDEAREERREASAETRTAAEADAQAWANSYASSHDRLTPDAARELRARIQQFANARNERFTESQLTALMSRVLDHQPPRPGSNDPSVRAAAAEPLPSPEPAAHHDASANPDPNAPENPNVAPRERPDGSGSDYRLAKSVPNPNQPPNPNVLAARVPVAAPPPPPPPPGAAVPPPPPPGTPTATTTGTPSSPPLPPGTPVVAGAPVPVPGAPVAVPGAPIVPGEVPGEPAAPVRMLSLGDPVRGMTGEEHQDVTTTFVTMRANFNLLTSTNRGPIPMPNPTVASNGETLLGRLHRQATSGKSGAVRGREGGGSGRGNTVTDRDLALGMRRGRSYA